MADPVVQINPMLGIDEADPVKLGPLAAPTGGSGYTAAAMGFSLLGGILKGMADIQAGNQNADTAERNAQLALLAGGDARTRGHIAAQFILLRGSQMAAKQQAAYAGSGVDVNSGSAVEAKIDTKAMSGFDALMAENNAAREAWGYEQKANQFKEQAAIDRASAYNQAGSDILGGAMGAATYGIRQHLQIS